MIDDHLIASTRARSAAYLGKLGPQFEIEVARCATYSALLRGECLQPEDLGAVLDSVSQYGRAILSGRGASGKSSIMRRLVLAAADSDRCPILLDLSRWDHSATEEWQQLRDSPRQALDLLLRRFQPDEIDSLAIDSISPDVEKLLLVDGLNEVPGATAEQILAVCDALASLFIGLSVIVSDRLVRRAVDGERERWSFFTPLPVAGGEINRLVPATEVTGPIRSLLDNPFFLDRAIRRELRGSALATIRQLFEERGRVSEDHVPALARAAYLAYENDQSRAFSVDRFAEAGANELMGPLLESGLLLRADADRVAFAHHWYHDYLASFHVISDPELWGFKRRQHTFDALTFRANSFDAIAFALELLGTGSDEFLRAVYDWNPYAAGYALAETEAAEVAVINPELRTIILAMLAEKIFDRHYLSAERARDALNLFRDQEAIKLREATSRERLIGIIADEPAGSAEFMRWRELFVMAPKSRAKDEVVEAVLSDDSIIGWTAANVLKQLCISDDQLFRLVNGVGASASVVRWRASHVLGASDKPIAVEALLNVLDEDPDENVRYGAVRSLIEIASHSDELAAEVSERLVPLLPKIAQSTRVLSELRKAIFLAKGVSPKNWTSEISDLLYSYASASDDVADMEEWSRLTSRLRQHERAMAGGQA